MGNESTFPLGGYTGAGGAGGPGGVGPGGGGTVVPPGTKGSWYLESCPGQPTVSVFAPEGRPPPVPVTPQQLATQASNELTPGPPVVQMSPPSTSSTAWQYTNLPTWVWVAPAQWKTLDATASVPGVTVTATAVPVRLTLTYQDGLGGTQSVSCNGPGTPYSDTLAASENPSRPIAAASPDCGWTWQHSGVNSPDGKLQVTASIVYNASWTAAGAPGGGSLGTITSPPAAYRVTVGQIEAIITGGR